MSTPPPPRHRPRATLGPAPARDASYPTQAGVAAAEPLEFDAPAVPNGPRRSLTVRAYTPAGHQVDIQIDLVITKSTIADLDRRLAEAGLTPLPLAK